MTGTVVRGKHIGTLIGFPTANIALDQGEKAPGQNGVYLAAVSFDGRRMFAIVNQGRHPTFPEGGKTIEAHIIGYEGGDMYGKRAQIEYLRFMRPERKFAAPEELTKQISADRDEARRIISEFYNDESARFIIETAREGDEGGVMKLYKSLVGTGDCTWNDDYPSTQDVAGDISIGGLYVMKDANGRVIAAVATGKYGELDGLDFWSPDIKNPCELCRLGVSAEYQNQGIAARMLGHAEEASRKRGFDGVRLLVGAKNRAATKLYDRAGYARAGETRKYDMDWVCREKRL